MSVNFALGDLVARIKNGNQGRKDTIVTPASRHRGDVLEVLKREGFIRGYEAEDLPGNKRQFTIMLKYYEGEPVIREMSCVSTPGRRVYAKSTELPKTHNGLGVTVISTPRGVMTDLEAREAKLGGEVLCKVF